jgi:pyridoxine 4-dehydrogenase
MTDTFNIGSRTLRRLGFGAMQLAGPGAFAPPKDPAAGRAVLLVAARKRY